MHKKKRIRLKHFTDKRHDKVLRSLNNIVKNDSVFMARELISNKVLLFIRTIGPALQKKANAYTETWQMHTRDDEDFAFVLIKFPVASTAVLSEIAEALLLLNAQVFLFFFVCLWS